MREKRVSLSDHFTYKKIFHQVITPILMMMFISIYGMVDGLFVSNFDGEAALAGINLIFPIIMIVGGLGFMFGSGGSALTAKLLGEKKREEACQVFTMIVMVTVICGIVLSVAGFFLIEPIAVAMGKITEGTTQEMVDKAIVYGCILMCGQTLYMIQNLFQNFFAVDEKQNIGFFFTLAAGITNIALDALFIVVFRMGIIGAAIGTLLGFGVASIGPIIYFFVNKNGLITFVRTNIRIKPVLQSCLNGLSDFIFNISASVVGVVFNIQLLKYFGQDGVNIYGVIMYLSFVFVAIFIGYSIGMGPVIAYNYGAKNHDELKNVLKKSWLLLAITSLAMFILSCALARILSGFFLGDNVALVSKTAYAMRIYSISFLMAGFCIFTTSTFTALNNGVVSGLISIFRTLIFQIITVFLLPLILQTGEGIWWAPTVSELLSILLCVLMLLTNRKKYNY